MFIAKVVLSLQKNCFGVERKGFTMVDVVFVYIGRNQPRIGHCVRFKLPSSLYFSPYAFSTCVALASEDSDRTCLFYDKRIALTRPWYRDKVGRITAYAGMKCLDYLYLSSLSGPRRLIVLMPWCLPPQLHFMASQPELCVQGPTNMSDVIGSEQSECRTYLRRRESLTIITHKRRHEIY